MALRIVTAPGGGGAGGGLTNINVSASTTSNNLSNLVFSNANGVTFGLDGSTITGSVAAGAAGYTYKQWDPYWDREMLVTHQGNGTLVIEPVWLPNVQFDRFCSRVIYTNASNSTGSMSISNWFGIYTSTGSTLSLLSSTSQTCSIGFSGTEGSWSLYSGLRFLTWDWVGSLPASDYWVGVLNRTTTAGTAASWNQVCVSMLATNHVGLFGVAPNVTCQRLMGQGSYIPGTTSSLPDTIAFSQINGSFAVPYRAPAWVLLSQTA